MKKGGFFAFSFNFFAFSFFFLPKCHFFHFFGLVWRSVSTHCPFEVRFFLTLLTSPRMFKHFWHVFVTLKKLGGRKLFFGKILDFFFKKSSFQIFFPPTQKSLEIAKTHLNSLISCGHRKRIIHRFTSPNQPKNRKSDILAKNPANFIVRAGQKLP